MAEVQGFEEDLASVQTQDSAKPCFNRRLSDKILLAFHAADDQDDYEIAEQLLLVLEKMLSRRMMSPTDERRKNIESLVAAHPPQKNQWADHIPDRREIKICDRTASTAFWK
jgi:hypothetical protein